MKLHGQKIIGPNREIIPIPRGEDDAIIFIAEAVLDDTEFAKLCPVPEPRKRKIDGQDIPNLKDPNYLKNVENYAKKKTAWMIIKSLQATEGLEWEQVDLGNPSTWMLYEKELKDSSFTELEINRIVAGCLSANGINEEKIDAARQRFLRVQQAKQDILSSPQVGLVSTSVGEPAKDLESVPQE